MLPLNISIERLSSHFTDDFRQPKATRIFFRALVGYTLIKMIAIWSVSRMVISHHDLSLPGSLPGKVLLAPSFLANQYPDIFFGIGICFLMLVFFVRSHYVANLLFFWLTFNLYIVNLPVSNGSDIVLFMLSLWCIPLAVRPAFKNSRYAAIQKAIYNLALIFCQLQVGYIYFVSGMDKLLSETWRSGEAFDYIRHLELLYNPVLPVFFESRFWNVVFSWSTILFELLFVVLVWINKTRLLMLLLGTIFNLFIWIVLSLPDFALVMVVGFLIFLKDSDYARIKMQVRRRLP